MLNIDDLNKNLRKYRMDNKLSINELSQAARIDADTLRNYEMGTIKITPIHAERINTVLFVNIKAYFGRHFND